MLRQRNLQPIEVTLPGQPSLAKPVAPKVGTSVPPAQQVGYALRGSLSIGQQMLFFTTLQQTQHAGFTLAAAFDMLATQSRGRLRQVARQISTALQAGGSLGDEMSRYESFFTPPCAALIRAGEVSGKVPEMAAECNRLLATVVAARRQAITEMIIPLAIITSALLMPGVVYMVLYFVGQSMAVDQTIYVSSKLAFQNAMLRFGILMALIVGCVFIKRLSNQVPALHRALDNIIWHLPITGSLVRTGAQSRFLTALGALYRAGLPPAQCLEYASQSAGQMVIADRILAQVPAVRNGGNIADALIATRTMPVMVTSQIVVAEKSGKLDEAALTITTELQDIHRHSIRRFLVIFGVLALLVAAYFAFISIFGMVKGGINSLQNQIDSVNE